MQIGLEYPCLCLSQILWNQICAMNSFSKSKIRFDFSVLTNPFLHQRFDHNYQVFRIMKPLRLVKLFRLLKVSTVYRFLNEYDIMLFRKSLAELALSNCYCRSTVRTYL